MPEALFIADLHLEQSDETVNKTFEAFLQKVAVETKRLYILGDFFNFWIGDDVMTEWHRGIASRLAKLSQSGVEIFLMAGNRDFLLGKQFANLANCKLLPDPTLIKLGEQTVLLKHGDDLCTLDKRHQLFRKITRLRIVKNLFVSFPRRMRLAIAEKLRQLSFKHNKNRPKKILDVVDDAVISCLEKARSDILIHGHTHKPQVHHFKDKNSVKIRYVVGDWSDTCLYLCYDSTKGLIIKQFCDED